MARFVLTPCRIREDRVVPSGEPVEMDWPKIAKLLAPSQTSNALMVLRRMRVNAYIGLLKHPTDALGTARPHKGPPTNFLFQNQDKGNGIGWLLKRNPNFPEQVELLYRVDEATFDARFEEHSSGVPN